MAVYIKQPPSKDNYIDRMEADQAWGETWTAIRTRAPLYNIRTLLEFDISDLPAGAIIDSAILKLYYYNKADGDPVGRTYWAYKLTRPDWSDSQCKWSVYKTGYSWTNPGGDFVTSNPEGGSAVVPASYGWMSWNIKAIVEDAIANVGGKVEILIKDALCPDDTNPVIAFFYTSEYTGDLSLRPKLEITYHMPPAGRSYGYIF
jgi:hypothetical protein